MDDTRKQIYCNRDFKVISIRSSLGKTTRIVLVYDVDLHCATILEYHPKTDTYNVSFLRAFHRALAVLASTYRREATPEMFVDPVALWHFIKGIVDYLKAKACLVDVADEIYKMSLPGPIRFFSKPKK